MESDLLSRIEQLEKEVEELKRKVNHKSVRNYDKYLYRGKIYSKRNLVYNIINDYCSTYPATQTDTLMRQFNKKGFGTPIHNMSRLENKTPMYIDNHYYKCKTLNGDEFCLKRDWTIHDINAFIQYVNKIYQGSKQIKTIKISD